MRLKVSLDFGNEKKLVGSLALDEGRYYFKYDEEFLQNEIQISPILMPKGNQVFIGPNNVFDGLFGVFNDSLPDGWGKLLVDRIFIQKGRAPSMISALERLALVGVRGNGALIYEPSSENDHFSFSADLDTYAIESEKLLKDGQSNSLDEMATLGGNSVGARPKIHVYFSETDEKLNSILQEHCSPYIIKFRSQHDLIDAAKIEYVYYQMAIDCGIEMSPSRLFKGNTDKCYFGTLRFDQGPSWRKHFHSVSGLLNDNYRVSTLDYGHVMDLANRLENNLNAAEKVFRIAVFNLFAHNADDHTKNFGFLMDVQGNWSFSPAYDLTFSPAQNNCHQLSYSGIYQNPSTKELLKLASHFNIKNPEIIISQIKDTLVDFSKYAKQIDINKAELEMIDQSIQNTLKD